MSAPTVGYLRMAPPNAPQQNMIFQTYMLELQAHYAAQFMPALLNSRPITAVMADEKAPTTAELVRVACDAAYLLVEEFERRGWLHELPPWVPPQEPPP